jgi:hypothetical protein
MHAAKNRDIPARYCRDRGITEKLGGRMPVGIISIR